MTIRRGSDNGNIKGPSEKIRSSSIEEITQKQNTIEIELNKNKINNTSYDKQSFNNAEESDSNDDDDDDVPPLATWYDAKGNERDSDNDYEDKTLPDLYDKEQDLNAANSEEEESKEEGRKEEDDTERSDGKRNKDENKTMPPLVTHYKVDYGDDYDSDSEEDDAMKDDRANAW